MNRAAHIVFITGLVCLVVSIGVYVAASAYSVAIAAAGERHRPIVAIFAFLAVYASGAVIFAGCVLNWIACKLDARAERRARERRRS